MQSVHSRSLSDPLLWGCRGTGLWLCVLLVTGVAGPVCAPSGPGRLQNHICSCVAVSSSQSSANRMLSEKQKLAFEIIHFLQLCPSQWEEAASIMAAVPLTR